MDTLVVGGGVAGLALACALQDRGVTDVLVLEAAELGSGVTAGSLGGVRRQFSNPLEIRLALRGLEFWKSAEERFEYPCRFQEDGYLMMTGDEARMEALASASATQNELGGAPSLTLTADELGQAAPWLRAHGLVGGVWTPEDGRVNATDGVAGMAQAVRRDGGRIVTYAPVRGIVRADGVWQVTADRDYEAQTVVLASGLGTHALLAPFGLELGIYALPVRYAFTETALEGHPVPLTIDLDTGFAVEREGDGVAIALLDPVAAERSAMQMLEDVAGIAATRAPDLVSVGIRSTMIADADGCIDGRPYAGAIDEGLWVLAGFGGHGVVHAPPIAEQLASQIAGQSATIDISAFDPLRDTSGGAAEWMTAVKQADVQG